MVPTRLNKITIEKIMKKNATLYAYLTLVRFPSIFSAMSNIWAGFFIAAGFQEGVSVTALVSGLIASALFIMAGMALNDVADRVEDALERPDRPIPSKKIKAKQATSFSIAIIVIGLLLIFSIKLSAMLVAAILCYSIYLYNFVLKKGKYGPLAMALCRVFNLLLGVMLGLGQTGLFEFINLKTFFALLSLGMYIYLVTFLARDETRGNSRERATAFMLGMMLWGGMWLGYFLSSSWSREKWAGLLVLALLGYFVMRPMLNFFKEPSAKHTGKLVGVMLGCIPLLDIMALLLHQSKLPVAAVPLLLLFLAKRSARIFYVT